ncbi:MAG TPA: RNA polymerase sigma factor [Gammaproteobacteria bacterium]|nr:RNA polymerase sigma factor [Gammaproteobacteria bacterium]
MASITRLWSSDRHGDGFEALLRPHIPALYRFAFHLAGNQDDAEDLVQDLLLRLYPRRDELAGIDKLRPWLARVLYRLHIDRGRRQRRSPVVYAEIGGGPRDPDADSDGGWSVPEPASEDPADDPEASLERRDDSASLQQALARLSEDHRTVLLLHDVEGFTLAEIETTLEVPVGTLKSRLHRARARLRGLLDREGTLTLETSCKGERRRP